MKLYKYSLLLLMPLTMMVSCKKADFVAANVSPSTLASVDPGAQFLYAARSLPNDFEAYYDNLRDLNAWMQFSTVVRVIAPVSTCRALISIIVTGISTAT